VADWLPNRTENNITNKNYASIINNMCPFGALKRTAAFL
jgi:hypothetical protein